MVKIPEEILNRMKCAECMECISRPPIYLKKCTYVICGECYQSTDVKKKTTIRNKIFEDVAPLFTFPCKNVKHGCTMELKWGESQEHEKYCKHENFLIFSCPSLLEAKCAWQGKECDILEHFKEAHSGLIIPHPYKFKPNQNWIVKQKKNIFFQNFLMQAHGFLFILQFKICLKSKEMWLCVSFLGDTKLSPCFEYFVEFLNTDTLLVGNLIKILQVHPISETINTIKSIKTTLNKDLTITVNLNNIKCLNCNTVIPKIAKDKKGFCCEVWNFMRNEKSDPNRSVNRCLMHLCGCPYIDLPDNLPKHLGLICMFNPDHNCPICGIHVITTILDHVQTKHRKRYTADINLTNITTEFGKVTRGLMITKKGTFMCEWGALKCFSIDSDKSSWPAVLCRIFTFKIIIISDLPPSEEENIHFKTKFMEHSHGTLIKKSMKRIHEAFNSFFQWQVEFQFELRCAADVLNFEQSFTYSLHIELDQ